MFMFQPLEHGTITRLPATAELAESWHQWSRREIDALELAVAAKRPLLVRGEPGTGKTQLARAAAQHLSWRLETTTIHARYEAQDLQFRFDAVKRLADAQSMDSNGRTLRKREADYWEPGPLWRSFDWSSACRFGSGRALVNEPVPLGQVLLIDEIDKAESDLPNALLEALGQRSFRIPALGLVVGGFGQRLPLVIFTTNEERELPAAFLRRCIVLNLDAGKGSYQQWLVARGQAHFGRIDGVRDAALIDTEVLKEAARQLDEDRRATQDAGLPPPGVAEYLDLLYALHNLAEENKDEQLKWLKRLSHFAYRKHGKVEGHPELDQPEQSEPDAAAPRPPADAAPAPESTDAVGSTTVIRKNPASKLAAKSAGQKSKRLKG
jgi:MoxR-like ATPase